MKLADPDSLPRTSPKTMAVLILILICLMAATFKAALYPGQPSAWKPLHDPHTLSMADANTLLSKSGAVIEAIKASADITTQTWNMRHRTGQWLILVRLSKTPKGDVVQSVQIRSEITHFPSLTRTWDYPEATSPAQPAPAAATPPPAASAPTPPAPAANAPAK